MLAFSEIKRRNKEFCQIILLVFNLVSYINGKRKHKLQRLDENSRKLPCPYIRQLHFVSFFY